ncbi:MAG: hypothetical protein ACOC44_17490 [Promethearchaeia archaeon]
MEELKDQIEMLKDSVRLKDDQIKTIKDSVRLKDDQIKTLEDSLKLKEDKIETLEKTIELKENQIKEAGSSSVNPQELQQKEQKISELKQQIDILNEELIKSDEEVQNLELELEKLQTNGQSDGNSKITDFTNVDISREEILEKMRDILSRALSKVTLVVPTITDLMDLQLYDVRSSVNLKISCLINPGIDEHAALLEEFEVLDNISLRAYEEKDRYVIIRDGEELLMAVIGNKPNNHLAFQTKDAAHIKLFNSLVLESWLRSRKI